jgi:hypothetical protein
MALNPTVAVAIFGLYIAAILLLFGVVGYSIIPKNDKSRLFEQRPFLFLRCALGALLSTWYCKLRSFYSHLGIKQLINSHDQLYDGMSSSPVQTSCVDE